ncbi:MAG: hypothetical protein LBR67_11525 [Dysgonamonadaceae bacterium]|jgi:hypothetical protein|nr:hypothetical protein [Dysgonamonadaceae bacterium]
MIFIYSPHITSRLKYVADHLFKNTLGTAYQLSEDKEGFLNHAGTCINYSADNLNQGIQIVPCGLLSEMGVFPRHDLKVSTWNGLPCFFFNNATPVPFDLFAASFYLLTLYEEYCCADYDEHQRFIPDHATAHQNGFLEIPLVDRWAYRLKDLLIARFGGSDQYKLRKYQAVSTMDVDHPYLYRNKGLLKNAWGACRDLLHGKRTAVGVRIRTLLHLADDPYMQSIRQFDAIHKQLKRTYYLFVLIAEYGRYGRATIYPQRKYFNYVKSLKAIIPCLHASYRTLFDGARREKERTILERLLQRKISRNRQHYLRIHIPETYRSLANSGFEEDFSLAFAKTPGFRSGTAIPHYFFDVENNNCTSLLLRPTTVMDTCLIAHLGLSPDKALERLSALARACKQSGGDFVMLWHNSNLTGTAAQNPWINVFTESYKYALSLEEINNFEPQKQHCL